MKLGNRQKTWNLAIHPKIKIWRFEKKKKSKKWWWMTGLVTSVLHPSYDVMSLVMVGGVGGVYDLIVSICCDVHQNPPELCAGVLTRTDGGNNGPWNFVFEFSSGRVSHVPSYPLLGWGGGALAIWGRAMAFSFSGGLSVNTVGDVEWLIECKRGAGWAAMTFRRWRSGLQIVVTWWWVKYMELWGIYIGAMESIGGVNVQGCDGVSFELIMMRGGGGLYWFRWKMVGVIWYWALLEWSWVLLISSWAFLIPIKSYLYRVGSSLSHVRLYFYQVGPYLYQLGPTYVKLGLPYIKLGLLESS